MRPRGERRRDEGASLVEYALLIALIALATFFTLQFFGGSRDNSLSKSGSAIFNGVVRPMTPLGG